MKNQNQKTIIKAIVTLIFIFGLTHINVYANDVKWNISGKVIEDQTNMAIPYASVVLLQKEDQKLITGTITDDNGQFELSGITLGEYSLKISFIGYKDVLIEHIDLNKKK